MNFPWPSFVNGPKATGVGKEGQGNQGFERVAPEVWQRRLEGQVSKTCSTKMIIQFFTIRTEVPRVPMDLWFFPNNGWNPGNGFQKHLETGLGNGAAALPTLGEEQGWLFAFPRPLLLQHCFLQ